MIGEQMGNYKVYKHTAPNGMVYIGATKLSINMRWRGNGEGYKKQKRFYEDILNFGWDNFKHEILFEGLSRGEASKKEIELIRRHKANRTEYGYNIRPGGKLQKMTRETKAKIADAQRGKKYSIESKLKMSLAKKGRTGALSPLSKKVTQYDLRGNVVQVFAGVSEAERITNIPSSNICKCCKGERKSAGGYVWAYGNQ